MTCLITTQCAMMSLLQHQTGLVITLGIIMFCQKLCVIVTCSRSLRLKIVEIIIFKVYLSAIQDKVCLRALRLDSRLQWSYSLSPVVIQTAIILILALLFKRRNCVAILHLKALLCNFPPLAAAKLRFRFVALPTLCSSAEAPAKVPPLRALLSPYSGLWPKY